MSTTKSRLTPDEITFVLSKLNTIVNNNNIFNIFFTKHVIPNTNNGKQRLYAMFENQDSANKILNALDIIEMSALVPHSNTEVLGLPPASKHVIPSNVLNKTFYDLLKQIADLLMFQVGIEFWTLLINNIKENAILSNNGYTFPIEETESNVVDTAVMLKYPELVTYYLLDQLVSQHRLTN